MTFYNCEDTCNSTCVTDDEFDEYGILSELNDGYDESFNFNNINNLILSISLSEWAKQMSKLIKHNILNMTMGKNIKCCANALGIDVVYLSFAKNMEIQNLFWFQIEIQKFKNELKKEDLSYVEIANMKISIASLRKSLTELLMPEYFHYAQKAFDTENNVYEIVNQIYGDQNIYSTPRR